MSSCLIIITANHCQNIHAVLKQNGVLTSVLSLLSPIGQHRSNHVIPSKGKRSKKRQREEEKKKEEPEAGENPSIPPTPEISSFIIVGLNNITRSLEALSQKSKPTATTTSREGPQGQPDPQSKSETNSKPLTVDPEVLETPADLPQRAPPATQHFAAIFVPRSSQPPILHAHLPQLIATASFANPSLPATRLVQLPKGCDARLCDALGLQRVSFIGVLEGAPHSKALVEIVRENVAEIDVPWLREVRDEKYLSVKVNAIQTSAPVVEKEKKVL